MKEQENVSEGSLKGRIEAILFVAGEAVSLKDLSNSLKISEKALKKELDEISSEYDYEQRGFMLKRFGDKVQLATPKSSRDGDPGRCCLQAAGYQSRSGTDPRRKM